MESQAKEAEDQECSFHPTLFTNLRRSKSTSQLYGSGDSSQSSKNIFDALYEYGLEQNERKRMLIHQHLEERESSSFRPIIPQRSNKLAEKKRKKRFYGAAVQSNADAQSQGRSMEGEGEEDYLSAREGGDDLYSRRSSLETNSSPVTTSAASAPDMDPFIPLATAPQETVTETDPNENRTINAAQEPLPLAAQISPHTIKSQSSPKKPSIFDMLYEVLFS